MREEPSVKGSLMLMNLAGLKAALADGRLCEADLAPYLREGDSAYLDMEIVASAWYPIEVFSRFGEANLQLLAGGDVEHYREQGAKAVTGFMGGGSYKGFVEAAETQVEKAGQILVGAAPLLFNFSEWSFADEQDGGFLLEVRDAELIPESFVYSIAGFFEAFFSQVGRTVEIEWDRSKSDHIQVRGRVVA